MTGPPLVLSHSSILPSTSSCAFVPARKNSARFRQKCYYFLFRLAFSKTVRSRSTLNCVSRRVFVSSYLFSKPVTCLVTSCSIANVELLSEEEALPSAPLQSGEPTPLIRSRPSRSGFKLQTSVQPNSSPQKEPIAI